ncbi:GntR family transcriptional regulator [Pseudarthrobacter sp. J64]|uniref:GntR family transcriptional regulator n=1 Tax=Pseudarthrobacter sp. J64 TaxID=3116485 RepID=UPI002E80FDCF|nr:GntR family transcriptional regulator [Pseudarthrobacter sp. J64]MEE2568834.1 GntR family transcriptional regulator [Pseudarthrobacter sp. J64]
MTESTVTTAVADIAAAAAPGSKSEQAYQAVKARIVEGTYTPGYRLVLGAIAKDLGFSVVPVREAIRRLEAEGLVKFERNVGATVAGIDPTEYLYTMQTLSIVEGAATALSAPLIDAVAIARARAVNEEMRECLEHFNPVRFTQLNQDFHSILFEHCPNPHILDLVHRGWNRLASLRSSTFRFVPGRAHDSVDEHEALLKLIESGADADAVEKAARLHRSATLDAYLAQAQHH